MSNPNEKDFLVHIPLELVKGDKEHEDEWKVRGIASTGDTDLQGEQVEQEGLDISALQAGRGLFNFDHQKGPENVLGIIEDAKFVTQDGKKALWVEGYLFKHQERSKAFFNILKSLKKGTSSRVHMSIEGKIIERSMANPKSIRKARIDKVALTMDPVNPYTFTELCKSLAVEPQAPAVEELSQKEVVISDKPEMVEIAKADLQVLLDFCKKAMTAGAGASKEPSARTGGEAMIRESMESSAKCMSYSNKKKKNKKVMIKSLIDSLKTAYPGHDPLELAGWAIEVFLDEEEKSKGE